MITIDRREFAMTRTAREPDHRLIAAALRDELEAMERDAHPMSVTEEMLIGVRAAFADAVASVRDLAENLKVRRLDSFREEVRRQPATACAVSMLVGMIF